jgi:hypothetical protein
MTFIVNDDGSLSVGPPDGDPVRRRHANLIGDLAWQLESDQQFFECLDSMHQSLKVRVATLEATVATLEALVIGEAA